MISERFNNDESSTFDLDFIQRETKNKILEKIENGIYKYEYINCECGNSKDEFEVITEKDGYGLNVNTVICKKCGLVMINPRMNQESYNQFYDNEYRKLYNKNYKIDKYFDSERKNGKAILNFIQENYKIKNKSSILEIGCGAGGILSIFQEKGYSISGVDLDSECIEYGKKQNLNIKHSSSHDLLNMNKKYDVIILNNVIEHFLNLEQELDIIKKLLNKDGIVYIGVPSIKSIENYFKNSNLLEFIVNAHTYYFTLDTVKQVMRKNEFKFIIGNERIDSIFKVNNKMNDNDIINFYYDNIKFLKNLENKYIKMQKYKDKKFEELFNDIRNKISKYKENEVSVYGIGEHTKELLQFLNNPKAIKGLLDNDSRKIGMRFHGYEILDLLKEKNNIELIIISSLSYQEEIFQRIRYLEDEGIEIVKIY